MSLLTKIGKFLIRKEIIIVFVSALLVLFYFLFFKPNPPIRVNLNKLQAAGKPATLTLDAPAEVEGVGKEFTVDVKMNTVGYFVNAVQSYVSFDNRALEVRSISTEKSFCKFYVENTYDNEKGMIRLSCGAPYPGFRGENTVSTIRFYSKAIKTTELHITNESLVLANDGKGTNLLKEFPTVGVKIKAVL